MVIVKYKKDQGLVYVKMEVEGTPTWYYYYQEDQKHENSNTLDRPKRHSIGEPHELVSPTHNWEFRLANPSNNSIMCNVSIEWFQKNGVNERKLAKWDKKNVELKANGGKIKSESAILIGE